MPRPDCPRCGSVLVVPAAAGTPSEQVLELSAGTVPVVAVGGGFTHWLCRSCGHQWDPAAYPERWFPGPGDPLPEASEILADLEVAPELRGDTAAEDQSSIIPAAALRTAREQNGTTLSEASKVTGIWERYLQALEGDSPLEEFPAPAYARFFLREYAEFLRLEPTPLLREFDARHPVVEEPPFEPLPDGRGRRKVVAAVMAVLSATALVVIAFLPPASRPPAEPAFPVSVSADAHDSGHVLLQGPVGREPRGVRAVLRLSEPSWVLAMADGETLVATTLQPGEPVVYRARRLLELTLGNAGGVRLRVGGEPVETGGRGDVVRIDFRWKEGVVLTERG